MGLLIVLFWATVGGGLAHRFHMPGGAFIGALLACLLYRVLATQPGSLPVSVSLTVQILAGVLVGSSFDPELLRTFKHLLPWAFLGAILYLGIGFLLAHPTCSPQWTSLNRRQPCTALLLEAFLG